MQRQPTNLSASSPASFNTGITLVHNMTQLCTDLLSQLFFDLTSYTYRNTLPPRPTCNPLTAGWGYNLTEDDLNDCRSQYDAVCCVATCDMQR